MTVTLQNSFGNTNDQCNKYVCNLEDSAFSTNTNKCPINLIQIQCKLVQINQPQHTVTILMLKEVKTF